MKTPSYVALRTVAELDRVAAAVARGKPDGTVDILGPPGTARSSEFREHLPPIDPATPPGPLSNVSNFVDGKTGTILGWPGPELGPPVPGEGRFGNGPDWLSVPRAVLS